MPPQPPSSTLFPYTTLFRSLPLASAAHGAALGLEPPERPVAARSTAEVALRNPQGSGFHHQRCRDRKSTRLNSSHEWISYAVFCLKKKRQSRTSGGRPTRSR